MRPSSVLAEGAIYAAIAHADGIAVSTSAGIALFDRALARVGAIRGAGKSNLLALPDGQFLTYDSRWSELHAGAIGGELAKVDLAGDYATSVIATPRGYLALAGGHIYANGTPHDVPGGCQHGAAAFGDGAVVAGFSGVAIVDGDGELIARSDVAASEAPVVVGDRIVVPSGDELVIFDAVLHEHARIAEEVGNDGLVAFATGVIARERGAYRATYWDLADLADPREVWSHDSKPMLATPYGVRRFAVLPAFDGPCVVCDDTRVVATLPFTRYVRAVAAFGDGVVFAIDDTPAVTWWRRGDVVALPHDVAASGVIAVAAGLASYEDRALYLWRLDADGPEHAAIACDYPLGVPVVVGGQRVVVEHAGRYQIRGVTPAGKTVGLAPGLRWRPQIAAPEARAIVDRLVARMFAEVSGAPEAFHDRDLAELVDLHGRAMFAPASLSAELLAYAEDARGGYLDELGAALGTSRRVLRAALKARTAKLVPPHAVAGYDYLGTFTTSGAVTVSDPCHLGKSSRMPGLSLAHKMKVAEGTWHVFARNADGTDADRTAELVAVHERGFQTYAADPITSIGVDAGCVGIFDKACPKVDLDRRVEEGTVAGLGALTWSGYGDGMYPLFAGSSAGEVVKLRVSYIGDMPEVDCCIAGPSGAGATAKPYSVRTTFAVGERVGHPKFGEGVVVRVLADHKLDIRFADSTRTLVHGKP